MWFQKKKQTKIVTRPLSDLSNSLRMTPTTREQAKAAAVAADEVEVAKAETTEKQADAPPKIPLNVPGKKSTKEAVKPEVTQADETVPRPHRGNVERMNTWMRTGLERSFLPMRQTRSSFWILLGCTTLVVVTQIILAYQTNIGMVLNIVTFLLLMSVALLRTDLRQLTTSLAILPVVNMIAGSFITHNAFGRIAALYGVLLVLTLVYRYLFTLDAPVVRSRLQLKGHALGIPLMLILGEVVGVLGYVFLGHHYPFADVPLVLVCVSMVVFAFAEEMFLRGLVQKQAELLLKPWWAMSMTSLLYAALAFTSGTLLSIGPAIAMGVVLALVYRYKQNLLLSTTINAAAKLTYVGLVATFILR